jgi:hypothetical protein
MQREGRTDAKDYESRRQNFGVTFRAQNLHQLQVAGPQVCLTEDLPHVQHSQHGRSSAP